MAQWIKDSHVGLCVLSTQLKATFGAISNSVEGYRYFTVLLFVPVGLIDAARRGALLFFLSAVFIVF